ncbi:MAG: HAD family hydrolase [Myxococcaceae bacterium]|nr:HAD family hydrolase [Myxococcaceae bacterium]
MKHVIFDVDDVMVDTDAAGIAAMAAVDARIAPLLQRHYETLIANLRGLNPPAYAPLRRRIEGWQQGLSEVKQWSRECLVAICFEDLGVRPTRELILREAATYWRVVTEKTVVYPDARELAGRLLARGITVHFASNSDGFLGFDEATRRFTYDPAEGVRRKIQRLALLREVGMHEGNITVGDPIGKPHPEFYERALSGLDRGATLVVGDSLSNDVLPFLKAGARQGVWLRRHGGEGEQGVPAVKTLLELERWL